MVFIARNVILERGNQYFLCSRLARYQCHNGLHGLTPSRIWNVDNGNLLEGPVSYENLLDFTRADVLPPLPPIASRYDFICAFIARWEAGGINPGISGQPIGFFGDFGKPCKL